MPVKKFETSVREDVILSQMAAAVRKAMSYVADTQSSRKFKTTPRIKYASISHFSGIEREFLAYFGMLTEKQGTHKDVRVPEGVLIVEAQVGSGAGGCGRFYAVDDAPHEEQIQTEDDEKALEEILRIGISNAVLGASDDYQDRLKKGSKISRQGPLTDDLELMLVRMKDVQKVHYIGRIKEREEFEYMGKILQYIKDASRIISQISTNSHHIIVEDPKVKLVIREQTRRLVNSEGTVIRDRSAYYGVSFNLEIVDSDKRIVPIGTSFLVSDLSELTEKKDRKRPQQVRNPIIEKAHKVKSIAQHLYSCPTLKPGLYDCILSPTAMADYIHEAVAHSLATSEIMAGMHEKDFRQFKTRIAPEELSIYMVAQMKDRRGFDIPGSRLVDAEGVLRVFKKGKRARNLTPLILNGVLVDFIADRYGAAIAEQYIRAYASHLTGIEISPGNADFDISAEEDYEKEGESKIEMAVYKRPSPRQPILDVRWNRKAMMASKEEAFELFKYWLRKTHKKMGLYIDGGGEGDTKDEGDIAVTPLQGFIIRPKSRAMTEEPVKFLYYRAGSHASLHSIARMFGPREISSFLCEDSHSGIIPTSIKCPGGIVRNLDFSNTPKRYATSYLLFKEEKA
ncbi:MAG: metallopeptidase TldD-related protein [Nanoarchaeota archaeon]